MVVAIDIYRNKIGFSVSRSFGASYGLWPSWLPCDCSNGSNAGKDLVRWPGEIRSDRRRAMFRRPAAKLRFRTKHRQENSALAALDTKILRCANDRCTWRPANVASLSSVRHVEARCCTHYYVRNAPAVAAILPKFAQRRTPLLYLQMVGDRRPGPSSYCFLAVNVSMENYYSLDCPTVHVLAYRKAAFLPEVLTSCSLDVFALLDAFSFLR